MNQLPAYIAAVLMFFGAAYLILSGIDAAHQDRQRLAERAESLEAEAADAESRAEEAWMEVHRLRLQLIQAGGKP
jgi:threonine/homoserine/homoserine lactone efflux protein